MKREYRYLLAILALLAALSVKSVFIDGVGDLNADEARFAEYVYSTIDSQERWAVNKTDVLTYKIVKIIKTDDEPVAIETSDGEKILGGHYTARVRKYILKILPYGDFSITVKNK